MSGLHDQRSVVDPLYILVTYGIPGLTHIRRNDVVADLGIEVRSSLRARAAWQSVLSSRLKTRGITQKIPIAEV
jgi:hypothetical protein